MAETVKELSDAERAIWVDVYKAAIPQECRGASSSAGAWWQIEYAVNAADTAIRALRERTSDGPTP